MRTLKRNQIEVKYALYDGKTEILSTEGYRTGQYKNTYKTPVTIKGNVSSAKGTADAEIFGISLNYTKTLIVDDMSCPIDEHTMIKIDSKDFVVVRVAKSLNSIAYALKEVDVDA